MACKVSPPTVSGLLCCLKEDGIAGRAVGKLGSYIPFEAIKKLMFTSYFPLPSDRETSSRLTIKQMEDRTEEWGFPGDREDFFKVVKALEAGDFIPLHKVVFKNISHLYDLFPGKCPVSEVGSYPFPTEYQIGSGADGSLFTPSIKQADQATAPLAIKMGKPASIFNEYLTLSEVPIGTKGIISLHPSYSDIFFYSNVSLDIDQFALGLPLCKGDALAQCNTLEGIDNLVKNAWDGLRFLEGIGRVHMDIKPGNILQTQDGAWVLADFGCSCKIGKEPIETQGTLEFMAPEVYDALTHRTKIIPEHAFDVWSLSATALQLLERFEQMGISGKDFVSILSTDQWWKVAKCHEKLKGLQSRYSQTFLGQIILQGLDPNPLTRLTIKDGLQILGTFANKLG